MIKIFYSFLLLLLPALSSVGQEYSYTQYGIKDGLAGSTVYCMVQDKEGFLWFGTESGLSRFDGTHFKNFTREDGLPDNEIIQLYADSKGRVWIAPFKKTICYYYKGKIYNADSDSLLNRIPFTSNVLRFAESPEGDIAIQETDRIHLVTGKGTVQTITAIDGKPVDSFVCVSGNRHGGFYVVAKTDVYKFSNNQFSLIKHLEFPFVLHVYIAMSDDLWVWRNKVYETTIKSVASNKTRVIPFTFSHMNFNLIDESHIGCSSREGFLLYDINDLSAIRSMMPGTVISNAIKDNESNLWFCTMGQGVFRLNSEVVFNLKIAGSAAVESEPVLAIARFNQALLAGTSINTICELMFDGTRVSRRYLSLPYSEQRSRITDIQQYDNQHVIYGSDNGIIRMGPGSKKTESYIRVIVKNFVIKDNRKELVVATNKNVLLMDAVTLGIKDTLWNERATTVFASADTTYIGTLNGLYYILPGKPAHYMGDDYPVFKNRITALRKVADGTIWVSTFGDGIVSYQKNKVVTHLTKANGLASNTCNALFVNNDDIWVGTDKGLNKINKLRNGYSIRHYTTGDGLGSDIINTIYAEGTNVYVGTAAGLTYFDESKINSQSRCDLRITSLAIGNQPYQPDSLPIRIPVNSNSMRIDYVGISYKSGGDIQYRYYLKGLDTAWKTTRETFLSYPTLPSGQYNLQLQAINKFGVYSEIISLAFEVEEYYWEKTWFRIILFTVTAALISLLIYYLTRRIRLREEEKSASARRMNELEQLALKSQMNPHFIFNCLNSIQQFVMDKDVAGSNRFISNFSRLIRKTLDFSSKPYITIEEEIGYLSNYLELEKMRLEDKFHYSITIANGMHTSDYYIPPMILQPYLENSIRHGIRYRRDNKGIISISVQLQGDALICIIDDNGIGRKEALRLKSKSPIEYQSKGMSLTANRVAILNKDNRDKITIVVDDLENDDQQSAGTRVTVTFPVIYH